MLSIREQTIDGDAARFLSAMPAQLRPRARSLLMDPKKGGRGLRAWLSLLAVDDRDLPDELPGELIEVYLRDSEAEPLHDCEKCGLPIPVGVDWRSGHEPQTVQVYFPECPRCGGRTGPHAYWSRSLPTEVV